MSLFARFIEHLRVRLVPFSLGRIFGQLGPLLWQPILLVIAGKQIAGDYFILSGNGILLALLTDLGLRDSAPVQFDITNNKGASRANGESDPISSETPLQQELADSVSGTPLQQELADSVSGTPFQQELADSVSGTRIPHLHLIRFFACASAIVFVGWFGAIGNFQFSSMAIFYIWSIFVLIRHEVFFWQALAHARQQFSTLAQGGCANAVVTFSTGVALVGMGKLSAINVIGSLALGNFFEGLVLWYGLRSSYAWSKGKFSFQRIRKAVGGLLPFALSSWAGVFSTRGDVVLASIFLNSANAGILGTLFAILGMAGFPCALNGQTLFPIMLEKAKQGKFTEYRKIFRLHFVVGAVYLLPMLALAIWFLASRGHGLWLSGWLLLLTLPLAVPNAIIAPHHFVFQKERWIAFVSVVMAVVKLCLGLLLGTLLGFGGLMLTYVIANFIQSIMVWGFGPLAWGRLPKSLPSEEDCESGLQAHQRLG